jgi:hypothetical protein
MLECSKHTITPPYATVWCVVLLLHIWELERKRSWPNLKSCPSIFLEIEETHKERKGILSQDSHFVAEILI